MIQVRKPSPSPAGLRASSLSRVVELGGISYWLRDRVEVWDPFWNLLDERSDVKGLDSILYLPRRQSMVPWPRRW